MNNKECIDILNGILSKMNCTGFSFDIDADCENGICIKLMRERNFLNSDRRYEPYISWETIDDMINTFPKLYLLVNEEKNLKYYRIWVYDVINENGFKFLEIASRCRSIEEIKLKIQVMGYKI